jgi:hypothetical protein
MTPKIRALEELITWGKFRVQKVLAPNILARTS